MEPEKKIETVCNLNYLSDMMAGKKTLIKEIIDVFLKQMPEELQAINDAVAKTDYPAIRGLAHTMKSSVSIMGISVLTPVLQEMVDLAKASGGIEKIKELNQKVNLIGKQAIEEIESAKHNYI